MKFLKPAINKMAFGKVGIYGDAGSGKTYTAAKIAVGLVKANGLKKPVAMFDTEPAASFIIPLFQKEGIEFMVFDESRTLIDLMGFMREAEQEASVVIVDSITHVWKDLQESFLARINQTRQQQRKPRITKLEFHHWGPIKAEWGKFTDLYLSSKVHAIVCGRAGSVYEYQENEETGKKELITSGTKMAVEKEMGYEPSLLIEMVKRREGHKIINRALIEKDRSDKLNGEVIEFPDFEKLRAHFDFLNLGGQHFSISDRNSAELFTEDGEDNWSYEKRQREIFCEEIQGTLVKFYPGTTAKEKQVKADLLERFFDTRSWTKVESMKSIELKERYLLLKNFLEGEQKTEEINKNEIIIDTENKGDL